MNFNNIPNNFPAKGYPSLLTNNDNVTNKKYNYSSDTDSIMAALDINWCGAELTDSSELGATENIETTEQLLTLINNMNKRIYALTAAVIALSNK